MCPISGCCPASATIRALRVVANFALKKEGKQSRELELTYPILAPSYMQLRKETTVTYCCLAWTSCSNLAWLPHLLVLLFNIPLITAFSSIVMFLFFFHKYFFSHTAGNPFSSLPSLLYSFSILSYIWYLLFIPPIFPVFLRYSSKIFLFFRLTFRTVWLMF